MQVSRIGQFCQFHLVHYQMQGHRAVTSRSGDVVLHIVATVDIDDIVPDITATSRITYFLLYRIIHYQMESDHTVATH
jgi:hypothetical protein